MDWYKIRYLTDWKKIGLGTLLTVFILGLITLAALILWQSSYDEEVSEIILTPTCEDLPRIIRACESFYCEEGEFSVNVSLTPPVCLIDKTTISSQSTCELYARDRRMFSEIGVENFESSSLCQTTRESLVG